MDPLRVFFIFLFFGPLLGMVLHRRRTTSIAPCSCLPRVDLKPVFYFLFFISTVLLAGSIMSVWCWHQALNGGYISGQRNNNATSVFIRVPGIYLYVLFWPFFVVGRFMLLLFDSVLCFFSDPTSYCVCFMYHIYHMIWCKFPAAFR